MASSKVFTNAGGEALNEANLGQLNTGDGGQFNLATWGVRVHYNGSIWVVNGATGAKDQSGNITTSWNATGGSEYIELGLGSCDNQFSSIPIAIATTRGSDAFYAVKTLAVDKDTVRVIFYATADSSTRIATEDSNMDFYIMFHGAIGE